MTLYLDMNELAALEVANWLDAHIKGDIIAGKLSHQQQYPIAEFSELLLRHWTSYWLVTRLIDPVEEVIFKMRWG